MASNIKASPQEEVPEKQAPETAPDRPLLDLSDAAVKKLIRSAKKRGYVTHDQINSVLPSEEVNSEQIEDVLAMFSEMGVNVVETEEPSEEGEEPREEADEEAESEGGELVEVQQKVPAKSEAKEPTERTDEAVVFRSSRARAQHSAWPGGRFATLSRISSSAQNQSRKSESQSTALYRCPCSSPMCWVMSHFELCRRPNALSLAL